MDIRILATAAPAQNWTMRALVAPPENRGYSHEELTCESDMLRYGSLCTCGRHGAAPFRLAD